MLCVSVLANSERNGSGSSCGDPWRHTSRSHTGSTWIVVVDSSEQKIPAGWRCWYLSYCISVHSCQSPAGPPGPYRNLSCTYVHRPLQISPPPPGTVMMSATPQQFSRGSSDTFTYPRLPFLGDLLQLRVGTTGSGVFATWHLRAVEVTHLPSGTRSLFHCHNWVDKKVNWQRVLVATPAPATAPAMAGMGAGGFRRYEGGSVGPGAGGTAPRLYY